jgi:hypothetical protein
MKTTTKVSWIFLAVIGMALASPFGAKGWAALYSGYVGNRYDEFGVLIDTAHGMSATGNSWAATGSSKANKGVRLDWSVDPSGGNWVYTYSFTMASGAHKDIQNFDLQVADDFTASDLVSALVTAPATGVTGPTAGATLPAGISENSGAVATSTVKTITKGYQWVSAGATDFTFSMTITTTRPPVWGDFIVYSSEQTATDYLTAYNTDFGAAKGTFPATGGTYDGHVAVPGPLPPLPPQTLQDALDNATDTVMALATTYPEHLVFNRPRLSLQLLGGYDPEYIAASGWTTIQGSLTISDGTLTVANVEII